MPEIDRETPHSTKVDAASASPDELFALKLQKGLEVFTNRQNELLRLASFIDERAAELDNATRRAKEFIKSRLDEVDESTVDKLIGFFRDLESGAVGDTSDAAELTPIDRQSAFAAALQEITESLPEGAAPSYMEGVLRAMTARPGVGTLRSSLLVTLVGELEKLVDFVARACYERIPSALKGSDKSFTWKDIAVFTSLDDLRDNVVDQMIEGVLRGTLSDWVGHFESRFSIPKISHASTYAAQEVIQRRHCIVHNGGLVSQQYLDRLSDFRIDKSLGDGLEVTSEYFRDAADTLYLIAYSLSWALGFKILKEEGAIDTHSSVLANRSYFLLLDRRYELVKKLGKSAALNKIDESSAFVIRVNYWLAHKLSGEFHAVEEEVRNLEVKTRSRIYNLAKCVLLDEDEEAYRLAMALVRDEELRPEHVFTWPLLARVREISRKKQEDDVQQPPKHNIVDATEPRSGEEGGEMSTDDL